MHSEDAIATITTGTIFKHGLFAFFGALAHAIRAHRSGSSKGFLDFFMLTVMSSFSGVVFALMALYVFNNEYLTLAAAGSGGFLGVEGLTILATKVTDLISRRSV